MKGPALGPGGEDITWPDQVAPGGQRAPSTQNLKPQNSNLNDTIQESVVEAPEEGRRSGRRMGTVYDM